MKVDAERGDEAGTSKPERFARIAPSNRSVIVAAVLYLAAITPLAGYFTFRASMEYARDQLLDESAHTLRHALEDLEHLVSRLDFLPSIVASDSAIARFAAAPDADADAADGVNQKLGRFAQVAGTATILLLDRDGTVIAASQPALVRRNFADRQFSRPESGRQLDTGVARLGQSYFLSQPIVADEAVVGMLVVEASFEGIENRWGDNDNLVMVTDRDGMVFAANRPALKFRTLRENTDAPTAASDLVVHADRPYGDSRVVSLTGNNDVSVADAPSGEHPHGILPGEHSHAIPFSGHLMYLNTFGSLSGTDWTVHVMSSEEVIGLRPWLHAGVVMLALGLLYLAAAAVVQRRIYLRQRHELRSRAVAALRVSEAQARSIIDNTHAALFTADAAGQIETVNPSAVEIFGYTTREAVRLNLRQLIAPTSAGRVDALVDEAQTRRATQTSSLRDDIQGVRRDGSEFPLDLAVSYVEIMQVPKLLVTLHDRTEQKRIHERLQVAAEVVEHALEGIVVTDPNGVVQSINPAFTAITKYSEEDIVGRTPRALKSGRHNETFYEDMWHCLVDKGHWQGEIWNRRKDGEVYPEQLSITALRDEQRRLSGFVGIFSDITQRKKMEERLWQLAHEDALTGLANRILLMDRLQQALAHARRSHSMSAVVFIDLDGFKEINDTIGHEIGDRLLQLAAHRLKSCLREGDTAARLGGDEFILVLNQLESRDAAAGIVRRVLDMLRRPFDVDAHRCHISGSIGVSLYPAHGDNGEELIQNADVAMYLAKRNGKDGVCFYAECQEGTGAPT